MNLQRTRYFYLKLGAGNSLAASWLGGENELAYPAAVVFFDALSKTDYDRAAQTGTREPGMNQQPLDFYLCGLKQNWESTRMVVIHDGKLCVLKPAGPVRFLPPKPEESGGEALTRKAMPVEILAKVNLALVPAVLAGLPADQYLSRGTFRSIGHWGNLKAIDMVLNRCAKIDPDWNAEHWQAAGQHEAQLLECLGSTGLETLVARMFEAAGCFVPARTGGVLRDIDLFAHNDTNRVITIEGGKLGDLNIPPGSVTVQVKTWPTGSDRFKSQVVNFLIGLDVEGPGSFSAEWLLQAVIQQDSVKSWFVRSINWLPASFLALPQFQLAP